MYIAFNGTVAQAEKAFHTEIHWFSANGELYYANASEPALPSAIAAVVFGVSHLNNFRLQPESHFLQNPTPQVTSSITGNHFIAPGDFATIYNLTHLSG